MNLNRIDLKRQSLNLMRSVQPKAVYVALLYLVISFVLSELSARILGVNMTVSKLQQYMNHIQSGNLDNAILLLDTMRPSAMGQIISFVLDIALTVVFAGFNIYLLNAIRNTEPAYGNILDGFGIMGKVILLSLLKTIFVALWSMLLVIPGIIAAYRYKMALYILIDHPEMSVMDCLRESKRMMKGRKMDFFLLELSFIGWIILGSFGIAGYVIQIWTLPYMNFTYCLYYENIRNAY
ncbi:MAG: DUF975 family protein [Oscillospiraceae bacterium]|nr:DUF975 family protein [Oscillospiraceae bacterium]